MLGVILGVPSVPLRRLLVVGCHPDDIEIGCGGTLLALAGTHPGLAVTWVVLAAHAEREEEARRSAQAFLATGASVDIRLHSFRDGYFPYVGDEVKDAFEALKPVEPDLVLTHSRSDAHQDHRLVSELTWNTFRDHLVLEYEIPKYDGDLGTPNLFVPLEPDLVEEKLRLLKAHHASQADKHWFDDELFRGLMRIRGMECATRYAEAFYCRKLSLAIS